MRQSGHKGEARMPQTVLSVVLDVDPQSARHLSDLIEAFKRQQEKVGTETYGRLKDGVPSLHFLSMSVFRGADYDPIFVIEANFADAGALGPPRRNLVSSSADAARLKRPPTMRAGMIQSTASRARAVRSRLLAADAAPQVFSSGTRGLDRTDPAQRYLFLATGTILRKPARRPIRIVPPAGADHSACARMLRLFRGC